ncbi:radical SAM protein [Bacteroides sp.]|uniref:radical SAM protein n=1 Tax=Bacteroides sp. TaxID=29523 RepID=UPI002604BBCF|nr:radical SAM protein [Bacteroides sp.]MDD3037279.1 radical SAM protein [Bacteroides sp.]
MLYLIKSLLIDTLCRLFHIRRKPVVIQMPVTSRCNSRCKTCNIWEIKEKSDIDPDTLRKVLQDDYFSEVRSVGINGGELTLIKHPEEIINALLVLKKLDYIHIISNGLLPDRLLSLLEKIKQITVKHNVKLGLTLSVDGVGSVHDEVRGIKNCFERTKKLMDELAQNSKCYCDVMDIGCTLSRYNIPYVQQTDSFFSGYPFTITYHLAVPNKRIYTFDRYDYYVLEDERSNLLATEFFYGKFLKTSFSKQARIKFRYFANYYFLKKKGYGRLSQCSYLNRDVTIDENLDIFLCATASDRIENLQKKTPAELYKQGSFDEMQRQTSQYCNTCIHYVDLPNLKGVVLFMCEILNYRWSWGNKYKFLSKW